MNWRTLLFLPVIFISLLSKTYAQKGALYVQHYGTPITHLTNQNRAITTTDQGTMMMANTQGALHYNGERWQLLDTKSTLYALHSDSNRVYTGGRASFGYLERQSTGQYKYVNLTNADKKMPQNKGNFWLIGSNTQHIYFLSEQLLVQFDKKQGKITRFWNAQKNQPYTGVIVWKEKVFVNIAGKGMHLMTPKGELKLFTQGDNFKGIRLTSVFTSQYLPFFTANDNFLYRFDGTVWRKVPIKDQEYLNNHTLTTGNISNDRYIALGTVDGGVVLVDIYEKTKTLHIINNQTGLLDDEIFSLGFDKQLGLWIAHPLGISRTAFNVPIRSFQHYPGLVGNLTAVTRWQDRLYVGTTEGVFYLQKTKNYQDLVKFVTTQQEKKTTEEPTVTRIIKEKGGGTLVGNLINKAFGKKKEQVVIVQKPKVTQQKKNTTQKTTERLLQQQIYALKSFPYFFQKVDGFDGKVNSLVALPNQLLIGGSSGLYSYASNNKKVKELLPKVYVNQLKLDKNSLNVATNTGLKRLQKKGSEWEVQTGFEKITQPVYSLTQTNQQLWLGGENQVIKVTLNAQGGYQGVQNYSLPQYYLEKVRLAGIQGKPVLFLSDGVYRLKNNKFVKDSLVKASRLPYQTIQNQGNQVWTDLQRQWVNMQNSAKSIYLSLLGKIDDIYQDEKGKQLWVIHQNYLHSVPTSADSSKKGKPFELLVNSIINLKNEALPLDRIRVHQGTKAYGLKISLSLPQYLDGQAVEYQYRIKGLTKGWTAWQKSPELLLNLLPRGRHLLEIKARNGFGEESTVKQLKIRIIPPFWKTWWFYLIEISVLIALLLAAAVSSRFSKFERYSYILTFVTIITLFEFIVLSLEPSVDNFSGGVPVLKLVVNIILAISLNPIERSLAAWLSKNKHDIHA